MISEIMFSSLDKPTLKPKLYENASFLQITKTLFLGWALIAIYRTSMLSDTLLYRLCMWYFIYTSLVNFHQDWYKLSLLH